MAAAQNAKFRVLAADKLDEEGLDYIRSQSDAELINKPGITEDELAQIAGDADGMIVRSAVQVTAKVLANPGRLKVVARAGVGVDNIDLDAATDKGILVMNSADASTISTAEHAFALLISLARQIGPAYKTMSEGGWDRSKFMGRQLSGKTLGVVGFGRIGRTVAERALAFGMNVVAYDPVFNQPTALDGKVRVFQQFKDILPHADMLTFHVPLTDQTRGMLGAETFPLCKKGVMVVNASRGGVVDEDSLIAAIDAGQCGGAALDVFTTEPPAKDSPLRKHPKILLTPHLGASTKEAQKAVAVAAAEQLMTFLRGQGIVGAVNAGGLRIDLTPLQNAFVDLAQRMTKLLVPMITQGIGSVTIELSGKELAAASGTIERYALVGLLGSSLDVPVNVINVAHVARQRGVQLRTVLTNDQDGQDDAPELTIEVASPDGQEKRRIVGHIYDDMRPRVEEINGYRMDMIPAGAMVLILNEDRPGMIGLVGTEFGQAQVNIADMTISRRENKAMMVLKVDQEPAEALLNRLTHRPGILKVAVIRLPAEKPPAR